MCISGGVWWRRQAGRTNKIMDEKKTSSPSLLFQCLPINFKKSNKKSISSNSPINSPPTSPSASPSPSLIPAATKSNSSSSSNNGSIGLLRSNSSKLKLTHHHHHNHSSRDKKDHHSHEQLSSERAGDSTTFNTLSHHYHHSHSQQQYHHTHEYDQSNHNNNKKSEFKCKSCHYQFDQGETRLVCVECKDLSLCKDCHQSNDKPSLHQDGLAKFPHQFTKETMNQKDYCIPGKTLYDSLSQSFKQFKDRRCYGNREMNHTTTTTSGELNDYYTWINYGQVYEQSLMVGNGLCHFIDTRSFLAVCAINCMEWNIIDIACVWHGIRVIPIHHQASKDSISEIMDNSDANSIVITNDLMDKLSELIHEGRLPQLQVIIVLDKGKQSPRFQELIQALPNHIEVTNYLEMVEIGQTLPLRPHTPFTGEELATLGYTSGSTGGPKGVILYDRQFNYNITSTPVLNYPSYSLSFQTMAHAQRRLDLRTIFAGGAIGFMSGGIDTLFQDIQILNPNTIWGCTKRVETFLTFGSFLGENVKSFITESWPHVPLMDVYGFSEDIDFGISINGQLKPNVEYRLEAVPEFNYYPTDLPFGRGELCVKKPTLSSGYYKNDVATSQSFIDGWYKTGDIVEVNPDTRKLKIIDRKKHTFKLSSGLFITPEPLENNFNGSKFIKDILIYGDIEKTYLVAIIKPYEKYLIEEKEDLKKKIYSDILSIAKEKKLANYELPKLIELDCNLQDWSHQNGLLTPSGKKCRFKLIQHYKSTIEELYAASASEISTIMKSVLQFDNDDESLSFTQLGGDSISAIKLSNMIKETINVDIPTSFILNKENSLEKITNLINNKNNTSSSSISLVNWEEEMKLEEEIQILSKKINTKQVESIFLTGSTGYLGSHLLYQLLMNERIDKIYCLVRKVGFTSNNLLDHLNTKYKLNINGIESSRIIIVYGDLSLPRFGLNQDLFIDLANSIDLIIHNGAMVNLIVPYANTKATNVDATKEILKLAIAGQHLLPISYVSTIGVFSASEEDQGSERSETKEITEKTVPSLSHLSQLNGYRQSKLVAEQIIKEASKRGFPIIMHRPSIIYADSTTGIDNEHDLIRMIIRGLLYMGSYPTSDHQFNLVPVDWTSKVIVNLSLKEDESFSSSSSLLIYHPINETLVSLQSFGELINQQEMKEMKKISWEEWIKDLNETNESNPLYPLKSIFNRQQQDENAISDYLALSKKKFSCPFTNQSLLSINLNPCQPISNQIIINNLNYLNHSK
ncbi:Putative transposase [Cavenderia fasciculata]|uniref:Transposase n=1 Tax=Cavenderia fasciculata TaxID=261658 RepID=F4Q1G7_CACFS|nr:Putative transposase [Cavenderia fasciculata]EGG18668.1 Putative transposase [Cavenderia fasciculata]|eukprot:XP_004366572.1 Putative transposase [Cavenderia fasciculata]